jgi:MazG family protein
VSRDAGRAYDRLVGVMRRLLGPGGCPWDRKQTPKSIRAHLLEETHEVLAALDAGDAKGVLEELGDVLYQVVFLSELFKKHFSQADVIDGIADKLVRRHPWVFGTMKVASPQDAIDNWEKLKGEERRRAGRSVLDGLPPGLPALLTAHRLAFKAAKVGFDWPDLPAVLRKLDEELGEFRAAARSRRRDRMEDELGDLLFSVANVARKLDLDSESALRRTNARFVRRFRHVEASLRARGRAPEDATLAEMDRLWCEAKEVERGKGHGRFAKIPPPQRRSRAALRPKTR